MRFIRTKAVLVSAALAVTLAACGDAGSDDKGRDVDADKDAAAALPDGSRMKEIADSGKVNIGVKFDQPGLGFKGATDDVPTGFDIEIAKILASKLGLKTSDINWVETVSDNREPFLTSGKVDLVLASYSITDDRRKVVGQTGPYMITGQQLLVKSDSDVDSIDDLKGQEVCSVTGSTSIDGINEHGAKGVGFDSYSECVQKVLDGTVSAMSTDGSILMGYAAENEGDLKVVGDEFTEERIGVGYSKKEPEMCQWINDSLTSAFDDGSWADAFELTLGKSGSETPEPPTLDECPAA
ncbi:transporter substrate-binding domain-containing protein [Nocardioides jensenii]|uniref:transporter substrate-binding domain-containing protein n=1 Tax=Nocardioides jensenii TaxID=1843 RepID=UPI0008354A22|nr:transporter substrate-binding domain-containing protein [Nocardioides jensenii]